VIYITGNIGSGKSSVLSIFENKGYKVINADIIAESVILSNLDSISSILGKDVSSKNDIREIISNRKDLFVSYTEFIVPLIKEKIKKVASDKTIIEAPTYFETRNLKKDPEDFVILVTADKDIRKRRIEKRSPELKDSDIEFIMNSQIDDSEKIKKADIVIYNFFFFWNF